MTPSKATVPGALHRWVKVVNQKGVHARAAAKFVKTALRFNADIQVGHGGLVVPGTSIMGLMMLAAATGSTLEIGASGEEAELALDELEQLVAEGFEEP
jgi:phosphocarrier protein